MSDKGTGPRTPTRDPVGSAGPDSGFYAALLSLVTHQDALFWSRVEVLIAIQGAVLGGSYYLRHTWLATAVLLAGFFLTLLLFMLVEKDQRDRDVNLGLLDRLADRLVPADIKRELSAPYVRLSTPAPRWLPIMRGRYIIRTVIVLFMVLDLVFIYLYQSQPELFPLQSEEREAAKAP